MANKTFFDKCFKDTSGKVVLAQKINFPITVWAVSTAINWIFDGILGNISGVIAFGALFTWAWLELFEGVNYFRRGLGFIVLVFIIWNRI